MRRLITSLEWPSKYSMGIIALTLCACSVPKDTVTRRSEATILSPLGGSIIHAEMPRTENYLILNGWIDERTYRAFVDAIFNDRSVAALIIENSEGGYYEDAQDIGSWISIRDIDVHVVGECLGACIDILVAGELRTSSSAARFGLEPIEDADFRDRAKDREYYEKHNMTHIMRAAYTVPQGWAGWLTAEEALSYSLINAIIE